MTDPLMAANDVSQGREERRSIVAVQKDLALRAGGYVVQATGDLVSRGSSH